MLPQQHIRRSEPAGHRAHRPTPQGFGAVCPRPPQPKGRGDSCQRTKRGAAGASRAATAGGGRPLPGWRSPSGEPCLCDPRGRAGGAPRPALSCGRQHSGSARTRLARAAPPSPFLPPTSPCPPPTALVPPAERSAAPCRDPARGAAARPGTPSSAAAPGATTRRRGEAGGEAAPRCMLGAVVPAPPRAVRVPPLRTACPGAPRAGRRAEGKRRRGLRLPWHRAAPGVCCGVGVTAARSGI